MSKLHKYNSSFDLVTTAFWKKQNVPYRDDLKSIDVIDRKLIGDKLFTRRVLVTRPIGLPSWVPAGDLISVENTVIDRSTGLLTGESYNTNFRNLVEFNERFEYKQESMNTVYNHKVNVSIHIPFIGKKIESLILEAVFHSSNKGISIIESLIN